MLVTILTDDVMLFVTSSTYITSRAETMTIIEDVMLFVTF